MAKGDDKTLGGGGSSNTRRDPREQYLDMEGNEFFKQTYETYKAKSEMSEAEMKKEADEWGMTLDQYKEYVRNQMEDSLQKAELIGNPEVAKKFGAEKAARAAKAAEKRAAEAAKGPDPGWAERYLGKKGHDLNTLEKSVANMSKEEIIRKFPDMGLTTAHSKVEMVSTILTELQNRGYKHIEA